MTQPQCIDFFTRVIVVHPGTTVSHVHRITFTGGMVFHGQFSPSIEFFQMERRVWLRQEEQMAKER